jgi:hypothetical protein
MGSLLRCLETKAPFIALYYNILCDTLHTKEVALDWSWSVVTWLALPHGLMVRSSRYVICRAD